MPRPAAEDRDAARRASAHLERSTTWAGIRAGDPVAVEGPRLRAASWSFLAHVRNVRTGEEWVEVVGGRPGSRSLRSFRPEQIFAAASRGGRRGASSRSPLAVEPRLPL